MIVSLIQVHTACITGKREGRFVFITFTSQMRRDGTWRTVPVCISRSGGAAFMDGSPGRLFFLKSVEKTAGRGGKCDHLCSHRLPKPHIVLHKEKCRLILKKQLLYLHPGENVDIV